MEKKKRDNFVIHKVFINSLGVFMAVEIANSLSKTIDGMITGHFLGTLELAASGLASPYFSIVGILSGILSVGMQSVCSKSMGEGDMEETNRQFSTVALIAFLTSIVVTILGIVFVEPICAGLGASGKDANLLPYTKEYLVALLLGTPALIGFSLLSPIMQLDSDGKRVKYAATGLAIGNIAGDLINVYIFHAGMMGMGLATSFSMVVGFVILLLHFRRKDALFRFSLRNIRVKDIVPVFGIGLPRAARRVCNTLRPILLNRHILYIGGKVAMSAYSVQKSVEGLALIAAYGVSEAVFLISGIYYGEQDRKAISKLFHEVVKYGLMISAGIGATIFLLAPWLAEVYTRDSAQTQGLAVIALQLFALSIPFTTMNESFAAYIQMLRKKTSSMVYLILQKLAVPLAVCYLFTMTMGTYGVFMIITAAEMFMFFVAVLMVWKENRRFPTKIDDFMILPDDFGTSEENAIEISVQSMEQVIGLSIQVEDFCKNHGVNNRKSCFLSLFVEEMAGNVVEHGFNDGKKHGLDIRVLIEEESLILRMRDDCRPFDIKKKLKEMDTEDICKGAGIRIVLGLADQVSYVNALRTNNLFVVLSRAD